MAAIQPQAGVKHVHMFGIREGTRQEQLDALRQAALSMPAEIAEIKWSQPGLDLLLPSGQQPYGSHGGKNRAFIFAAKFDSDADYEVYAEHPVHQNVLNTFIGPIMEPGSHAAIQYGMGTASAKKCPATGVRHIVMFGVKASTSDATIEELKTKMMDLENHILEIKHAEFGADLKLAISQNHSAGKNCAVLFTAVFEDEAAYEVYATHPVLMGLVEESIAPIIEPGSRAAVQYRF